MLINTREAFFASLDKFTDTIVLDTETDGLDVWQDNKQCGIGVCTTNEETFYYPFRHDDARSPLLTQLDGELNLPMDLLHLLLARISLSKKIIGHNLKFDLTALVKDGLELPDDVEIEDTLCMARLCLHEQYADMDLESVVDAMLPGQQAHRWKTEFKEYLRQSKAKNYAQAHPKIMAEYCERDCLMTWRVYNKMAEYITATKQDKIREQERELLRVVWEMERDGLYFDRQYVEEKIVQLRARLLELEKEICDELGVVINIGSTPQLTKALNDKGIFSPKLTKAKKQSWDNEAMKKLGHPIGAKILNYRSFQKMLGTYLEPPLKWADDYMHPSFNQARPITGRFSCSNPNLQNLINGSFIIKSEKVDKENTKALSDALLGGGGVELADEFADLMAVKFKGTDNEVAIKRMFVPPPGYKLWLFDEDQMEMRVFADYVDDPLLSKMLESDKFDFHKFVAMTVWGAQPGSDMWSFYRKLAKAINFGLIFCVGDEKLGMKIQKTTEEAGQYKLDYFARFPKASQFIQNVIATVKQRGYVFNRFGRRYVIDPNRAYVGINYLVQGTSADVIKNRMIACAKYLKSIGAKSRMVVQVHDELGFYIHESEESFVPAKIKDIMEERTIKTFLSVKAERGNPSWVQKQPMCVYCVQPLTKEEDTGDAVHPCDEERAKKVRRVQTRPAPVAA
jgi:DNA polymerase I